MLLRLSLRDLKRNLILNLLISLLLMMVFVVLITGISAVVMRMQQYKQIQPYLEKKGMFLQANALLHGEEMYLYKDSDEIKQYLSGAENVLSVARLLGASYEGKDINVWCYSDEVVHILCPEMEKGRYFKDEDVRSNILKAVVSYNEEGIEVGDRIQIKNDQILGNYQEVEIIGVMKDGEDLYQPEYIGELTQDYRQCFQPYYYKVQNDTPVILIAEKQILANQGKRWFPSVNYRVSDVGFMKEISGPIVITYPETVTDAQIENDMVAMIGNGSMLMMRKSLSEVNENSVRYVYEDIKNLMPVIICSILFIIIAATSVGVVSVKKSMEHYAIYYICGYRWKQCARISLINMFCMACGALMIVCAAIFCMQIMGKLENTAVFLGIPQLLVCSVVLLLFVLLAWMLPMILVMRTSAKQVLCKNR